MSLPYFGTYLGILLALSVLFAVMAKNLSEGMTAQGKKPYLYGGLSSIIFSALAWGSTFLSNNLFTSYWMLSVLFLIFGMVHQYLVKKKYFYALHHNKNKVLAGEIMYGISMVLFVILLYTSLQYFLSKKHDYLIFPMMMSSLFFFVPMLFQNLFQSAISIPPAEYEPWVYPLHETLEIPEEDPKETILVIGFELKKNKEQISTTYFRSKAPEHIKLGDLFYYFINDYNELNSETPITVVQDNGLPDEWVFSRKTKWFQPKKYYNANRNFRENGIGENTVIIAQRT